MEIFRINNICEDSQIPQNPAENLGLPIVHFTNIVSVIQPLLIKKQEKLIILLSSFQSHVLNQSTFISTTLGLVLYTLLFIELVVWPSICIPYSISKSNWPMFLTEFLSNLEGNQYLFQSSSLTDIDNSNKQITIYYTNIIKVADANTCEV